MKLKHPITNRQLVDYIFCMTRPFLPYLLVTFVLVVVEATILAAFIPHTIERVADITNNAYAPDVLFRKLSWPLSLFVLLQCVLEVNLRLQDYFFSIKTVPRLVGDIYHRHVNKLLDQSYQFYQHNPPGVISNNLTRLANSVPEIVESFVLKITFFVLTFMVAILSLWRVTLFAGVLLVCYLVFMVSVVYVFNKDINFLTVRWTYKRARMTARILDIVTNILTVKLFSGKRKEGRDFRRMLCKTWRAEQDVEYAYLRMSILLGMGYLLLQGMSVYVLLYKATMGDVSVGKLLSVLYLNETIVSLIWDDLPDLLQFSKQVGKAKQSLGFEYVVPKVKDRADAVPLVVEGGHVHFDGVTFGFSDDERPFFDNFNLTIPAGQRVGLVGYTGSGKTTLIQLLLKLYNIQQGEIRIDGQDIAGVTQDSIRKQIGLIPQDTALLQRSLRQNLVYGQQVDDGRLIEAAKKAEIHSFIMSTEKGYDSLVGEEGVMPSGGERQRLSVARLLLRTPSIVLLDEATSQLDSITEKSINNTLNTFMRGKTTIIIAHRLSTLMQVDRIIVLDKGSIVEDGTHASLLAERGLYAHFWQTQSDGFIVTDEAP